MPDKALYPRLGILGNAEYKSEIGTMDQIMEPINFPNHKCNLTERKPTPFHAQTIRC